MTQNIEKHHSFDEWNNQKINELVLIDSANSELPENIKIIDGRVHVTARWLASRFNIDYVKMLCAIHEIEPLVYIDNSTASPVICWINEGAFVELCLLPVGAYFSESARMTMLHLLGNYQSLDA